MHIKPLGYISPVDLSAAVAALADDCELTPLAGGTDLLVLMKEGRINPKKLLSLKHLPELKGITCDGDTCTFGASTTVSELGDSGLAANNPCIADAVRQMATPQIRNRATIGGNLCTSAACADFPPVLLINGAVLHLQSASGKRDVPISEFFLGLRKVDLQGGELLTSITCKHNNPGSAYLKFGMRQAANISIIGIAAALELDNDTVTKIKISSTAACPKSTLLEGVSEVAVGQPATKQTWDKVAKVVKGQLTPISDIRGSANYRLVLAEVGCVRVLEQATKRFRGTPDA